MLTKFGNLPRPLGFHFHFSSGSVSHLETKSNTLFDWAPCGEFLMCCSSEGGGGQTPRLCVPLSGTAEPPTLTWPQRPTPDRRVPRTLPASGRLQPPPPPQPWQHAGPHISPCVSGPGDGTQSSLPPLPRRGLLLVGGGLAGPLWAGASPWDTPEGSEDNPRSLVLSARCPCQMPHPCPTPGKFCLLFQQEGFHLQGESMWAENQTYVASPSFPPAETGISSGVGTATWMSDGHLRPT